MCIFTGACPEIARVTASEDAQRAREVLVGAAHAARHEVEREVTAAALTLSNTDRGTTATGTRR